MTPKSEARMGQAKRKMKGESPAGPLPEGAVLVAIPRLAATIRLLFVRGPRTPGLERIKDDVQRSIGHPKFCSCAALRRPPPVNSPPSQPSRPQTQKSESGVNRSHTCRDSHSFLFLAIVRSAKVVLNDCASDEGNEEYRWRSRLARVLQAR